MNRRLRPFLLWPLLLLLTLLSAAGAAHAGRIEPSLRQRLSEAERADEKIRVIIRFADRADLAPFARRSDRAQARREMLRALRDQATRTQGPLQHYLRQQGQPFSELWISNAVAAELPVTLIAPLANWPGVESIDSEGTTPPPAPLPQIVPLATSGWNLDAIGAPTLWGQGIDGSGTVVAILDTGVNPNHLELAGKFRGNIGDPGDWYNPYATPGTPAYTTPYDLTPPTFPHGTAVTSVILGTSLGVAPGAQWIAAKVFPDSGDADNLKIMAAFQWALDPNGDGDPDDAPDLVNGSWGFTPSAVCKLPFQAEIATLQQFGIHVVFAGGNYGPNPATSVAPGNNPEGFAVGAVDPDMAVSAFSSRGPSPCATSIYTPFGAADVFPELVAPGKDITVAYGGSGLALVAGTSFAAPHISGALSLLRGAIAPAAGQTAEDYRLTLEQALLASASDLDRAGPDDNAGYGLLDTAAAWYRLSGQPSLALYTPGSPENDSIVDFGNVPPETSSSLALRLRNVGGADLALTLTDTTAAPFALSNRDCPASLAPGLGCTIDLTFAPSASGSFTSSLGIGSNDPRTPNLSITLQGTGNTAPPAAILLAPIDGVQNQPASITFHWYQAADADGDPLTMTLDLSDGLTERQFVLLLTATGEVLLLALWPLLPRRRRSLRGLLLAGALAGLVAFAGCGGSGGTSLSANASITVSGLAPDTTYYWKVITRDNNGNPVESQLRTFKTAP